tara:strand:- start:240 stop:467 length:228 start_codon:yes stop_codon:yes gene_type:complete
MSPPTDIIAAEKLLRTARPPHMVACDRYGTKVNSRTTGTVHPCKLERAETGPHSTLQSAATANEADLASRNLPFL